MVLKIPLLCAAVFLSSPYFSQAQAPTLGAAEGFVILASGGAAISNTGSNSHYTGDLGVATGAAISITTNVNGVLHIGTSEYNAAALAVTSLYNQLQAAPPTDTFRPVGIATTIPLGNSGPGNNDTLTAGVDSFTVSTVLADTLVLDGQNNANAVFIFKINGGLTSSSTASAPAAVVLINGALACNVFWQVKGTVNIATLTSMKGTIITSSTAIDLAQGVNLEGRLFTETAGAITTTNVIAKLPLGCGMAVLTGPVAPSLGAVSCYTLFTSDGFNTNAGTSNITGDVGSNGSTSTTTGYGPPTTVNGVIHPVADGSTAAAANDLGNVETYLNLIGLTPDIELQFPAQFGNDLELTPHTYLLSAAAPITGTLYLNAQGNSNAVFVIKVIGALTPAAGATVVLSTLR